ncbi:MAG: hypothetical protein PHU53_06290 [Thermoplasmata archaeon]|nr:hypothetical protein [Thermoplasmata archaeon]
MGSANQDSRFQGPAVNGQYQQPIKPACPYYENTGSGLACPYFMIANNMPMMGMGHQPINGKPNWAGVTSLVLGIISITMCWMSLLGILSIVFIILSILAIVFGAIGLRLGQRMTPGKAAAIAGIILGIISLIITILFFMIMWMWRYNDYYYGY